MYKNKALLQPVVSGIHLKNYCYAKYSSIVPKTSSWHNIENSVGFALSVWGIRLGADEPIVLENYTLLFICISTTTAAAMK